MMAASVPIGMDFWASLRSPDLLDPAMIPGGEREDNHTDLWRRGGVAYQ